MNSKSKPRALRGKWVEPSVDFAPTPLPLERSFTAQQWEQVKLGSIPAGMDEHWFIFEEDGWAYFIRSWTAYLLYKLRFRSEAGGASIVAAHLFLPPEGLSSKELAYHAALVNYLIDYKLLGDDKAKFPINPD